MDKTVNQETGEYVFSVLDSEESIKWENKKNLQEWQRKAILETLDELSQVIELQRRKYQCIKT